MINFGIVIRDGNLKIGDKVWRVVYGNHKMPLEVQEWTLADVKEAVPGKYNTWTGIHFSNDKGEKEFAYAHHDNYDWYLDAIEAYQNIGLQMLNHISIFHDHLELAKSTSQRLMEEHNAISYARAYPDRVKATSCD